MTPGFTPGWAQRVTALLGVALDKVTEEHLEGLVRASVREDADLDFKRDAYGSGDSDKRELAADIAAMANYRGGVIIVGIDELGECAAGLSPVPIDDGEETRIRQVAAGNIAPHLSFEVIVVPGSKSSDSGFYLIVVPPSQWRPHAVRQDKNLRYPVRDGSTKRWLAEPEVADAYRGRFQLATEDSERVSGLLDEGLQAMDLSEDAYLAVGLVPSGRGAMEIDLARTRTVGDWLTNLGAPNYFDGFFSRDTPPTAIVGAGRITGKSIYEANKRPSWQYVELHRDGCAFVCCRLFDPRTTSARANLDDPWVLNESLVWALGRCLHVAGAHAVQNCGSWGDAAIEARLIGKGLTLSYLHRMAGFEHPEAIDGGRQLDGAASRGTVTVESLATVSQDLAVAVRLIATDLFHAFGAPEVRQIAADGALRSGYLGGRNELAQWAEASGLVVSDEVVAGE